LPTPPVRPRSSPTFSVSQLRIFASSFISSAFSAFAKDRFAKVLDALFPRLPPRNLSPIFYVLSSLYFSSHPRTSGSRPGDLLLPFMKIPFLLQCVPTPPNFPFLPPSCHIVYWSYRHIFCPVVRSKLPRFRPDCATRFPPSPPILGPPLLRFVFYLMYRRTLRFRRLVTRLPHPFPHPTIPPLGRRQYPSIVFDLLLPFLNPPRCCCFEFSLSVCPSSLPPSFFFSTLVILFL